MSSVNWSGFPSSVDADNFQAVGLVSGVNSQINLGSAIDLKIAGAGGNVASAFQLAPQLIFKWYDDNNDPASGWLVNTYIAGTTTRTDTYENDTGTVVNDNPIVLDARGEARIYLSSQVVYKFVITDALGGNVAEFDNITGVGGVSTGGGVSPVGELGDLQLNLDNVNLGASGLNWKNDILKIDNGGTGVFTKDYSNPASITTTETFDTGVRTEVVSSGVSSTTWTGTSGSVFIGVNGTDNEIRQEDGAGYSFSRLSSTDFVEDVNITGVRFYRSWFASNPSESIITDAGSLGWSSSGSGSSSAWNWTMYTPSAKDQVVLKVSDDDAEIELSTDNGSSLLELQMGSSGGRLASAYSGTFYYLTNNGTDSKLDLVGSGAGEIATLDSRLGLTIGSGGFNVTGNSSVTGTLTATAFVGDGSGLTNLPNQVAGANTQIQFNNSGAFGASSDLTWNGSTLAVGGDLNVTGVTTSDYLNVGEGETGSVVRALNSALASNENISIGIGEAFTNNNSGFIAWNKRAVATDSFLSIETFNALNPLEISASNTVIRSDLDVTGSGTFGANGRVFTSEPSGLGRLSLQNATDNDEFHITSTQGVYQQNSSLHLQKFSNQNVEVGDSSNADLIVHNDLDVTGSVTAEKLEITGVGGSVNEITGDRSGTALYVRNEGTGDLQSWGNASGFGSTVASIANDGSFITEGSVTADEIILSSNLTEIDVQGGNSNSQFKVNFSELTTGNGLIQLFRDTNTTGRAELLIHSADGTSTEAFKFDAKTGKVNFSSLPTSSSGLSSGDLWNDSGTVKIV